MFADHERKSIGVDNVLALIGWLDHRHFTDASVNARLIVISNRIVKTMGYDWFDQLEHAP